MFEAAGHTALSQFFAGLPTQPSLTTLLHLQIGLAVLLLYNIVQVSKPYVAQLHQCILRSATGASWAAFYIHMAIGILLWLPAGMLVLT